MKKQYEFKAYIQKKILTLLIVVMVISIFTPISINAKEIENGDIIYFQDFVSQNYEQYETLKKMKEYFVVENNKLALSKDINQIIKELKLNADQVQYIKNLLNTQYNNNVNNMERAHIYKNHLCITYWDLVDFFGVAGGVSAGGVVALFTLLGSTVPGIGNIAGLAVGIIGGGVCISYSSSFEK